jgi:2-amino-4-hydroxy-6-hydroxymethyldihydropteridine diphosphokinase
MNEVVLSLGSNLGNRQENLQKAFAVLQNKIGNLVNYSKIYERPAWGFQGNDFYNAVVVLKTKLNPLEVLQSIKEIETRLGRNQKSINGVYQNRIIDIDILYYNNQILQTDELTVPHPKIQERNFVLVPLVEILPDFFHPVLQKDRKNY